MKLNQSSRSGTACRGPQRSHHVDRQDGSSPVEQSR